MKLFQERFGLEDQSHEKTSELRITQYKAIRDPNNGKFSFLILPPLLPFSFLHFFSWLSLVNLHHQLIRRKMLLALESEWRSPTTTTVGLALITLSCHNMAMILGGNWTLFSNFRTLRINKYESYSALDLPSTPFLVLFIHMGFQDHFLAFGRFWRNFRGEQNYFNLPHLSLSKHYFLDNVSGILRNNDRYIEHKHDDMNAN